MFSLKVFLKSIIHYFEWETIFFTQDLEKYARVKGKLAENNILVKTKITNNTGGYSRFGRSGSTRKSYEILVKSEAVHKANEVLHR